MSTREGDVAQAHSVLSNGCQILSCWTDNVSFAYKSSNVLKKYGFLFHLSYTTQHEHNLICYLLPRLPYFSLLIYSSAHVCGRHHGLAEELSQRGQTTLFCLNYSEE